MAIASHIAKWQILLQGRRIVFPWLRTLKVIQYFTSREGNGCIVRFLATIKQHLKTVKFFFLVSHSLNEQRNTQKWCSPPPSFSHPSIIALKEQVQFYSHLNYKAIITGGISYFHEKEVSFAIKFSNSELTFQTSSFFQPYNSETLKRLKI